MEEDFHVSRAQNALKKDYHGNPMWCTVLDDPSTRHATTMGMKAQSAVGSNLAMRTMAESAKARGGLASQSNSSI